MLYRHITSQERPVKMTYLIETAKSAQSFPNENQLGLQAGAILISRYAETKRYSQKLLLDSAKTANKHISLTINARCNSN